MLVEQLSIAYKCNSSIGNSINLKEMIQEVLKTFVSESYSIYSEFLLINHLGELEKIHSFGRINEFDANKYSSYKNPVDLIVNEDIKVLKINLENAVLFFVLKNTNMDCSFFVSMLESFIPKLNISVNACINFQKLEQTNKYLEEQKKELIKANKIKDDFLANMSHELKTPLNSITVISSIMVRNKDNQLNENQIKNMKIIKKCSDDLLILINDILDISKLEAKYLDVFKEKFNVKNLLDELVDSFEEVVKQKNIEIKKDFLGSDFNIVSDEKRVGQIIKNFLSNAVKFTNKGYVQIKMFEFENSIEIDVIDTGIGIENSDIEKIFTRFKQVDDSRTRKFGGTGLGLAISKELANMLSCKIEVSSEFGVGSTFKLIIPKNSDEITLCEEEKTLISNPKSKEEIFKISDKKIFIMHSNSIEQFRFTIALKKENLKVIPIFNQEEFYSKIESFSNHNSIMIIDDNIINFNDILEMYNKNIDFIIIGSKEYENCVLNLNRNEKVEDLIIYIKDYFNSIKEKEMQNEQI